VEDDLRREGRHHGEGHARVGAGFRHATGALHLLDSPVEYDHLAIEIGEGTEPEIAMLQDRLDADHSVIDARDQGTGGRDLKQRVNRHAEVLGQGARNDRGRCSFSLVTSASNAVLSGAGMVVSRFAIRSLQLVFRPTGSIGRDRRDRRRGR
jgi:hypothetical protein